MRDRRHRYPEIVGPRCRFDGGPRRDEEIRYIVVHSAEAPSNAAPGVARYGATTNRSVSWHVVVDDERRIRCLPDTFVAWAAPGVNRSGLQIELCGYARYSRLDWYRHQATLKRAAWQVAEWCKRYGIPARWLADDELERGAKEGIVTHAQVSRVYRRSDHWDPGKGFPERYFMLLVRRRLRWLTP